MENEFLQLTLKSGLFDIGDSDDRLKWLQQSVNALAKKLKLKKNKYLLPKYTLVAVDPKISESEPVLTDVEEIVTKYWKALRGKYPEMPRNIHRGVILNALYKLGLQDPTIARIVYLTASNFYPYAKLGNEKKIVKTLLTELGKVAEQHAVKEWALIEEAPSLKLSTLKLDGIQFGKISLNKELLNKELLTAIQNEPSTNRGSNNGGNSTWGTHFANNASEGISKSFNKAFDEFNNSISNDTIEKPINNFFSAFKKSLNEVLKSSFSSIIAVERRSKLLWWKETLYSSTLKKSYREVSKTILPLIMGHDLNSQVAQITPVSVDYLLKDTLYIVNEENDGVLKFKDLFAQLDKDPSKSDLSNYFTEINDSEGRISITDFITLFLNDRVSAKEFKDRTGINESDEISTGNLSVTIFHDLLTNRLTSK